MIFFLQSTVSQGQQVIDKTHEIDPVALGMRTRSLMYYLSLAFIKDYQLHVQHQTPSSNGSHIITTTVEFIVKFC